MNRIAAAAALDPARTTRTTARDMATLLRLIWSDKAGPPEAWAALQAEIAGLGETVADARQAHLRLGQGKQ